MFTKNFFFLLQNLFARNINNSDRVTAPQTYDGATDVLYYKIGVTTMANYSLSTGQINNINTTGLADGISTESDLITNLAYKTGDNSTELTVNTNCLQNRNVTVMILGDGNTNPTVDDYKLESFIGSDRLKCTNCANSINDNLSGGSVDIITKAWTFQNITDSPVTVKELGLVCMYEENSNLKLMLLAREVLSSPVTIAPNAKYTFEFNLTVA